MLFIITTIIYGEMLLSVLLFSNHLISWIANKSVLQSCVTWIRFRSAPLLCRDSTFQVPTRKSLFILSCLCCFHPVPSFESFSTRHFYGVRLSAPGPTPNLDDQGIPLCLGHLLKPVLHGSAYR
jgi:hypothetical protein